MGNIRQRIGVRKRSKKKLFGLPLYDIAFGIDPETNQLRGRARGIIALGDTATGIIAFGQVARGGIAFGQVALGGVAFGLVAVGAVAGGAVAAGLLFSFAGYLAFSPLCAFGTVAVGIWSAFGAFSFGINAHGTVVAIGKCAGSIAGFHLFR